MPNPESTPRLHPTRRRFASIVAATIALAATPSFAQSIAASNYPNATITMIVGWPAGGPSDNVARLTAAHMSEALKEAIVIDNRAGAGGNIGTDMASRAKPDGYTIMLATSTSHGLNSALYARLNHDPIKDFAPVGIIASSPSTLLVPADSPFKNLAQLVAYAKANPGKLNYGSGGIGSTQHLAGASFAKFAGIDITHIPYKGTAPAMTDLMGGRVDLVVTTGVLSFVNSGKVRALAVASHTRLPGLPDTPTFDEAGTKGFYTDSWYGVVVPANTPKPVVDKLNAALATTLRDPEVQKQFAAQGLIARQPMNPDEFWTFVKNQMPTAAAMVKLSGATAE